MKSKKEIELIVKQNKNIIYKVAKSLKIRIDDYEDVLYEGYVGLLEAINKYDSNKKVKFSTYAYELIYYKMLDYLYKNEHYVTIDKNTTAYKIQIKKLYNEYKTIYKSKYDIIKRICDELHITEFELNNLINSKEVISFDEYNKEDNINFEEVELINKISKEDKNEYNEIFFNETLIKMLVRKNVTERSAKIFILIFFNDISYKEMASYLKCSESNIRNIISSTIKIIKNNDEIKELINEYIESEHSELSVVKYNN